jgi:gamma-glutamylcysteine synthetase
MAKVMAKVALVAKVMAADSEVRAMEKVMESIQATMAKVEKATMAKVVKAMATMAKVAKAIMVKVAKMRKEKENLENATGVAKKATCKLNVERKTRTCLGYVVKEK